MGWLFLLLLSPSHAHTAHTNGYWAGLFTSAEINESLRLHQEFQLRKNTETGLTNQSLFRAGPLWQYSEQLQLGLLYAFVKTGALSEHRPTQQILYKPTESITLRWRLEQRIFEKQDGIALRSRLFARYQYMWTDSFYSVGWIEYFYQLSHPAWVYDSAFDRNRYFLGFRSKWKNINLEYGYLNQYANRAGRDLSEHLFLMYLIL